MEFYIILSLFFIYGILIGSFLNVCIYRIPQKISVAKGRSFCPSCKHSLNYLDLIPIFSYLFLGKKCRYCKEKISVRYAVIELLCGILFSLCFINLGISYDTFLACLMVCFLVTLAFIDLDTKEIPNRFSVLILILAILKLMLDYVYLIDFNILERLLGFVAISIPLLIIALLFNGFGGGDIKLMAVAGLYLGSFNIILAFFIAVCFAFLYCLYIIIKYKAKGKTAISFGPYLSIGIFISMVYGKNIIDWYINLITPTISTLAIG